jgi:hypothetical protein
MSFRPTQQEYRASRIVAVLSAVFWGGLFYGLVDLLVAIDQTPGFYDSYLLETGWGLLFTFLVAAPCMALAVRPGLVLPLIQVAVVGLAVAVTAVASSAWAQLAPAVLLLVSAAFLADLSRGYVRPPAGWRWPHLDPVVALPVLVMTPPAVAYAVDNITGYYTQRAPTDDDTMGLDHWPMQAALPVSVVMVGAAVAAGVRNGWTGTAVSVSAITVTTGWLGVVSVMYPDHAASLGATWGSAALVWAVLFAAVATQRLVASRRGRARDTRGHP